MKRIRRHLTYANVAATLALFLALSGGIAFAAGKLAKNSVGANQLKAGAVSTAKIRDGAVTGDKVQLSTLGKVPAAASADSAANAANAAALQGMPASAFLRGGGQFLSARRELAAGEQAQLLSIPGIGPLIAICAAGTTSPKARWDIPNQSGAVLDETLQYGPGNDGGFFEPGMTAGIGFEEFVGAWTVQLATRATPSTLATFDLSFSRKANAANSGCVMLAQGTVATGCEPDYSPALNSQIAIASTVIPNAKTVKIESATGTVQPNQVTPGLRLASAAELRSRWAKTRVRIGSTA